MLDEMYFLDELYCLSFGLVYWIYNAIGKMGGLACDESFFSICCIQVRESEKEDRDEAEWVSENIN